MGELRRAAGTQVLEVAAPVGSSMAARGAQQLVVWDENTLDDAALAAIGEAVGLSVMRGRLEALLGAAPAESRAGAVAVALGLTGGRPGVDFLRPRVVAPRRQNVSRRTAWVSAAGVVAIIALLAILDLSRMQRRLDTVDDKLRSLEPTLKTARPFVQNMQFVETFASNHPKYLACLRDVTVAIPTGSKAYLTNFHLQASMRGEISGHAPSDQDVINLTDQLNASGHFVELKRKLESGGRAGDVAFSVTFTYSPH
jgi:hypothetical protein